MGEFDEFPDEETMHCTARLAEMLNGYSDKLRKGSRVEQGMFSMEEVSVLEDSKGIWLPSFLHRSVVLVFLESVVVRILMHHFADYQQLHSLMRRAVDGLVLKMKKHGMERMLRNQKEFMAVVEGVSKTSVLRIDGFWEVDVAHMRAHKSVAQQAFDVKMRVTAYWKVVLRRVVDSVALHLLFSVQNLVNRELEGAVVEELMRPGGGGIERMLEEAPSVANRREKLTRSVELLEESKRVLAQIMDFIE